MAVEKKNRQEKQDSWVNDPTYSISYQIPVLLKVGRAVVLFLLCFLLWMVLAKELHILAIIVGAVFSSIATLYSYSIFFEKSVYYRSDLIIRLEFFILYAFLLVVQSYLASFELIYRIIKGNYRPGVVRIKIRLRSQIGRTFLANTISMIPGTLSLWLEGSHIYVHWFDQKTDHSIKAGIMIKQNFEQIIQRIFG
jgi:multicomponent Na+:H+ antiporter subunit E